MNISIVGGGIAGLATAIAFKKAGIKVTVFEAAPAIKSVGAGLGLAPNSIAALEKLGIADKVLKLGHELDAFCITDRHSKLISETGGAAMRQQYGTDNFTIHRARLYQALLEELEEGTVVTSKVIREVKTETDSILLYFKDGSTHVCDYLIAADGIHSSIRKQLCPQSVVRYAGYACWRGVVAIPGISLNTATEVWDKKGRLGIVPLKDGQVYWFACVNTPRNNPLYSKYSVEEVSRYFQDLHPMAYAIISKTEPPQLLYNDICDIEPLSQYAYDRVLLIGDAAHAATPNMAQGACQALEDAATLLSVLPQASGLQEAFRIFEQQRLSKTHFIIRQSRTIGIMAQASNCVVIAVRNFLLRLLPASINRKQMERLYKTNF